MSFTHILQFDDGIYTRDLARIRAPSDDEALIAAQNTITQFCEARNWKLPYIRSWKTPTETIVDVGSHTQFFLLKKKEHAFPGTDRIIVVGDVHGCFYTLKALLEHVRFDPESDTLVFLGDYIDRGPHSFQTLTFLQQLQKDHGRSRVVCLRGNHEQMALDFIDEYPEGAYNWFSNGAYATLESLQNTGSAICDFAGWLSSLPLYTNPHPRFLCCHAGCPTGDPRTCTKEQLLWWRPDSQKSTPPDDFMILHGHTPIEDGLPRRTSVYDLNIDTACVFGGTLTAAIISSDGALRTAFVSRCEEDAPSRRSSSGFDRF